VPQTSGPAPLLPNASAPRAIAGAASHVPAAGNQAFGGWASQGGGPFNNTVTGTVRPVVGNRSLMIFHLPDCAWADKIPARRREDFLSPDAARSAGFRPCRVCTP